MCQRGGHAPCRVADGPPGWHGAGARPSAGGGLDQTRRRDDAWPARGRAGMARSSGQAGGRSPISALISSAAGWRRVRRQGAAILAGGGAPGAGPGCWRGRPRVDRPISGSGGPSVRAAERRRPDDGRRAGEEAMPCPDAAMHLTPRPSTGDVVHAWAPPHHWPPSVPCLSRPLPKADGVSTNGGGCIVPQRPVPGPAEAGRVLSHATEAPAGLGRSLRSHAMDGSERRPSSEQRRPRRPLRPCAQPRPGPGPAASPPPSFNPGTLSRITTCVYGAGAHQPTPSATHPAPCATGPRTATRRQPCPHFTSRQDATSRHGQSGLLVRPEDMVRYPDVAYIILVANATAAACLNGCNGCDRAAVRMEYARNALA
jgi:hypothetical protein